MLLMTRGEFKRPSRQLVIRLTIRQYNTYQACIVGEEISEFAAFCHFHTSVILNSMMRHGSLAVVAATLAL